MKRLLLLTTATALILTFVQLAHDHRAAAPPPPTPRATTGNGDPATTVTRVFLHAMLAGDLPTAAALSTPVLAGRLTTQPPETGRSVDPPAAIETTLLAQQLGSADVAVELHWPGGRIAAVRLRLTQVNGRWLIAEVGS